MRIAKNTSNYDTRFLRSLFCAAYREIAKYEGKRSWWSRLEIYVRRTGSPRSTGRAYLHGGPVKLTLSDSACTRDIAYLFWHEMYHVYGYMHKGGRCEPRLEDLDRVCEGLPEEPVKKRVKKKPSLVEQRFKRICDLEKQWQRKFKLAQTKLRQYQRLKKQYSKRHGDRLCTAEKE